MSDIQNELVEVSTEILPIKRNELVQLIESNKSFPISKLKIGTYLKNTIDQIHTGKDMLTVVFKVPREIQLGLSKGLLIRKGGVIVTADKYQVEKWLVESKGIAIKGSKAGAVLFNAIVIAETLLLDNKLKEIQQSLEKVHAYQKARYEAMLPNAIDFMKKYLSAESQSQKSEYANIGIEYLVKARNESQKLIDELVIQNHAELINSRKYAIYNNDNYQKMTGKVNEIITFARHVALCCDLEMNIHYKIGEIKNGEEARVELVNFIADVEEYVKYFSGEEIAYSQLGLVTRQKKPLEDIYKIDEIKYGDNYQTLLGYIKPLANRAMFPYKAIIRKIWGDRPVKKINEYMSVVSPEQARQKNISKIDTKTCAELEYQMLLNVDDLISTYIPRIDTNETKQDSV